MSSKVIVSVMGQADPRCGACAHIKSHDVDHFPFLGGRVPPREHGILSEGGEAIPQRGKA